MDVSGLVQVAHVLMLESKIILGLILANLMLLVDHFMLIVLLGIACNQCPSSGTLDRARSVSLFMDVFFSGMMSDARSARISLLALSTNFWIMMARIVDSFYVRHY